jgi:uncharacterized protein Smg (DUF494 family)
MCEDKIIDIIAWTVAQIRTENINNVRAESLIKQGYSEKDISTAYSWLVEKLSSDNLNELMMLQSVPQKSFRILSDMERSYFTAEAYSELIRYFSIGLISSSHIDIIIGTAEQFHYKQINPEMIKQFIASFLFDIPIANEIGSRFSLMSNDSIN